MTRSTWYVFKIKGAEVEPKSYKAGYIAALGDVLRTLDKKTDRIHERIWP